MGVGRASLETQARKHGSLPPARGSRPMNEGRGWLEPRGVEVPRHPASRASGLWPGSTQAVGCGGDRRQGGLAEDLKLGRLQVKVGSRGQEGHPGARGWDHKAASPRPRGEEHPAWDVGGRGEVTAGV